VVAIYPVFHRAVFKILAVSAREDGSPECSQISGFLLGYQHFVLIRIFRSTKLNGMFDTYSDEDSLIGVTAEIQVFLVIIGSFGISAVSTTFQMELILMIAVVYELTIAKVEVDLQPVFSIRYCPEAIGTDVNLWDGLGVYTFDERSTGKQFVS
jgi:hypothetical protein